MCAKYNNLVGDAKEAFRDSYEDHIVRKEESQKGKQEDKERAATDDSYMAITFDLQAVLYTLYTDVNLLSTN